MAGRRHLLSSHCVCESSMFWELFCWSRHGGIRDSQRSSSKQHCTVNSVWSCDELSASGPTTCHTNISFFSLSGLTLPLEIRALPLNFSFPSSSRSSVCQWLVAYEYCKLYRTSHKLSTRWWQVLLNGEALCCTLRVWCASRRSRTHVFDLRGSELAISFPEYSNRWCRSRSFILQLPNLKSSLNSEAAEPCSLLRDGVSHPKHH